MSLIIDAVNTSSNYFRVIGDVTGIIAADDFIQVLQSVGNDGVYLVVESEFSSGHTIITVAEPISSGTVSGFIAGGVYGLRFSDETIPNKEVLVITPYGTNEATTLKFNGKATLNFGEWQQRNVLHLLENFASTTAPVNPTVGQQWYDYTNKVVKLFDGEWSSDVNIEDGVLSFKDASHPTPNTKYFIAGTTQDDESGICLFPQENPNAGDVMFRVGDESRDAVLGVEFNGRTFTTNILDVTNSNTSLIHGSLSVNAAGNPTGATVHKDLVVDDGDVVMTSGKHIQSTDNAVLTVDDAFTFRTNDPLRTLSILSTGGQVIAEFNDSSVVLNQQLTGTTFTFTSGTVGTLGVTGTGTFDTVQTSILNVTTSAALAATTASSLTVTTSSTLNTVTATSITASGAVVGLSGSFTTLTGSSTVSLGDTTSGSLSVTNNTTLNTVTIAGDGEFTSLVGDNLEVVDLTVTQTTTLDTLTANATTVTSLTSGSLIVTGDSEVTNITADDVVATNSTIQTATVVTLEAATLTVTGEISVPAPTLDAHAAPKQYVDVTTARVDAVELTIADMQAQQLINFWMTI